MARAQGSRQTGKKTLADPLRITADDSPRDELVLRVAVVLPPASLRFVRLATNPPSCAILLSCDGDFAGFSNVKIREPAG